jgi:L,D-transpeptidase-like protein/putative peptidoglycan binding protein
MQTKGMQQSFIRVAAIFVVFWIVVGSCTDAVARKSVRSRQKLGVQERVEAERRLWELGYWAGPADGRFDSASRHALVAFQKVERRPRTGNLTWDELNALRTASRPTPRHAGYAHVEIDLKRQVLFLIDETGMVMRILPVSTGNGELYMDHGQVHRARTPPGTFKVLRKINGWRISSLGMLYYPSYILNGIAIHGSFSIPTHPASHGCIRIPMFAAKELSALMPVGMEVIVYQHEQSQLSDKSGL